MKPSIAGKGTPVQAERGSVQADPSSNRMSPINPVEQALRVQAFDEAVKEFQSMPDNDPPGAWEEAMRDLDAHRPHRTLFDGIL
jgi:hypothetical protein